MTDTNVLNMVKLQGGPVTFTLSRIDGNNTNILGISRGKVVQQSISPVPIEGLVRVMEKEGFKLIDRVFSVE